MISNRQGKHNYSSCAFLSRYKIFKNKLLKVFSLFKNILVFMILTCNKFDFFNNKIQKQD